MNKLTLEDAKHNQLLQEHLHLVQAINHDLRQPMFGISMVIATLKRRLNTGNTDTLPNDLERIQSCVDWLDKLIGSIVEYHRADAFIPAEHLSSITIQSVFDLLQSEFAEPAARRHCGVSLRPSQLTVTTSFEHLALILRNFIANAIRFNPGGKALIVARKRGGKIRIEVRDNGPGIHPEHLMQLFSPYFQTNESAKENFDGIGLGLATVQKTARILNGETGVRTTPGKGSLFWLELPTN